MLRRSIATLVVVVAALGVLGALLALGRADRAPVVARRPLEPRVVVTTRPRAASTSLPTARSEPKVAVTPPTTVQPVTTTAPPRPAVVPKVAAPEVAASQHPSSFLVADAAVAAVELFASPGTPTPARSVVANPTAEGLDLVFLVKEQRDSWLRVQVAVRPNGMEAWVRAGDVHLRRVQNWIRVELGARRTTVFHADTAVFQTTVAVGRSSAPTPTGQFFVDGVVLLDDPGGPYGVGQMSVGAFSDVYQRFGGGVGQIALHGTNAPGLLGQAVSHGCVRLDNGSLVRVMELAPTGTPVEIVP